jgi:hypothetical protein
MKDCGICNAVSQCRLWLFIKYIRQILQMASAKFDGYRQEASVENLKHINLEVDIKVLNLF